MPALHFRVGSGQRRAAEGVVAGEHADTQVPAQIEQIAQADARLVGDRQVEREFERLRRNISVVGRGEGKEMQHAGIDEDRHRGRDGRRADRAQDGEDAVGR